MAYKEQSKACRILKNYRYKLTPQQYRTLKGQILSGNITGAMAGLKTILRREKAI